MHTDFACLLYSKLVNKLPESVVKTMVTDSVDIERRFITESIPCSMIGMNADLMVSYIQFIADRLMVTLGYQKIYGTKNPFSFMEKSAADVKQSFFEVRVSEYSKPVSFIAGKTNHPSQLDITEDF